MHWLFYAFLTVSTWGLYGVFLHSGQMAMNDPVFGRYKAEVRTIAGVYEGLCW